MIYIHFHFTLPAFLSISTFIRVSIRSYIQYIWIFIHSWHFYTCMKWTLSSFYGYSEWFFHRIESYSYSHSSIHCLECHFTLFMHFSNFIISNQILLLCLLFFLYSSFRIVECSSIYLTIILFHFHHLFFHHHFMAPSSTCLEKIFCARQ